MKPYVIDNTSYKPDARNDAAINQKVESEANRFAVNLLLPTESVLAEINQGKTAEEIALEFGVSIGAARVRVESLTPKDPTNPI